MQTAWSPRAGEQPFPSSRELLGSTKQEGGGSDGCSLGIGGWKAGAKAKSLGKEVCVPVKCFFILLDSFESGSCYVAQAGLRQMIMHQSWSAVYAIITVLFGCS